MTATITGLDITLIDVDELVPGLDFRIDDDPEALAELAASIAEHGVLQPILVRRRNHQWEVVAGRRRVAAARMATLHQVPCQVRAMSDDEAADAALAENMHRRQLSAIEIAIGYAHLRKNGVKVVDIARRVGRTDAHVYQLLGLLKYPEDVRREIHEGRLSYGTVISHPSRFRDGMPPPGVQQGGERKPRTNRATGDEAELVSYWRRRHDRLIGGLYAIQKARPSDVDEAMRFLDKLLKLDAQPLTEAPLRKGWETFTGKGRSKGGRS